jgi:hypothetical protein
MGKKYFGGLGKLIKHILMDNGNLFWDQIISLFIDLGKFYDGFLYIEVTLFFCYEFYSNYGEK